MHGGRARARQRANFLAGEGQRIMSVELRVVTSVRSADVDRDFGEDFGMIFDRPEDAFLLRHVADVACFSEKRHRDTSDIEMHTRANGRGFETDRIFGDQECSEEIPHVTGQVFRLCLGHGDPELMHAWGHASQNGTPRKLDLRASRARALAPDQMRAEA